MKGVVDLFVAKDRTAILWFVIACASIALSALYVKAMTLEVRAKPQYVIMDSAGVYYAAPSLDFESARDLHTAQTQLAMETIFNRNPNGLDNEGRRARLLMGPAADLLDKELAKESALFHDEQFHQKVEVGEIEILAAPGEGQAHTYAKAQLIRTGVFKGKIINETWEVGVHFVWSLNKGFGRQNGFFPTVCILWAMPVYNKVSS